jgi:ABC-type antimicrobial peptide transport system permease subunit
VEQRYPVSIATIGLYGVISYMVVSRRGEIGIRLALGASPPRVVRLMLRETTVLVAIGLAAGAVLSIPVTRSAAVLLFGLSPHDLPTLAAAAAALALTAGLAGYLPARRAARVDPMIALRVE